MLLWLWLVTLLVMFALLQWSIGSPLTTASGQHPTFWTDIYMSGAMIFTLGLGDVMPRTPLAQAVTVAEAGTDFGLLALVIDRHAEA